MRLIATLGFCSWLLAASAGAQTYGPQRRGPVFVQPDPGTCPIDLPPMSMIEALDYDGDPESRCRRYMERQRAELEVAERQAARQRAADALRSELTATADPLAAELFLALRSELSADAQRIFDDAHDVRGPRITRAQRSEFVVRIVDFLVHAIVREAARRSGVVGAGGSRWPERFPRVRSVTDLQSVARALAGYERELTALLENIRPELTRTSGAIEMGALLGCTRLSVIAAREAIRRSRAAMRGRSRPRAFAEAVAHTLPSCSASEPSVMVLASSTMGLVTDTLRTPPGAGEGASESLAPGARVSVRIATLDVRGALPPDTVRNVTEEHAGDIATCVAEPSRATGRVTVSFIISPTGAVQSATVGSSTINNAPVEGCITQAVRRWRFPPPEGGGVVGVNQTFELAAQFPPSMPRRTTAPPAPAEDGPKGKGR